MTSPIKAANWKNSVPGLRIRATPAKPISTAASTRPSSANRNSRKPRTGTKMGELKLSSTASASGSTLTAW